MFVRRKVSIRGIAGVVYEDGTKAAGSTFQQWWEILNTLDPHGHGDLSARLIRNLVMLRGAWLVACLAMRTLVIRNNIGEAAGDQVQEHISNWIREGLKGHLGDQTERVVSAYRELIPQFQSEWLRISADAVEGKIHPKPHFNARLLSCALKAEPMAQLLINNASINAMADALLASANSDAIQSYNLKGCKLIP